MLGASNSGSDAVFYYNSEGQMVGKKNEIGVMTYTWDSNVLAAEENEVYVNEPHLSGGVPVLVGDEIPVTSDYLGNTLSIGNQSFSGTAFGEGLEQGRMTGKNFVEELGAFLFKHRLYSPQSCRWTTVDPSGYPDGANNQVYVGNDPVSRIDPFGLEFLHFNVNGSVARYDGAGYNEADGTTEWGNWLEQWSALSNNTTQSVREGQTPEGWYLLGSLFEGNYYMALGTERDKLIGNTWYQGGMSLWGEMNGEDSIDYWGFSDYNGDGVRQNRKSPTAPIGAYTQCWKFDFGINFQDNWGGYTFPTRRGKQSIKIHPEGGHRGTNGCMGIENIVDSTSIKQYLMSNSGRQILVEQ